jgi:hypothetical protein
LKRNSLSLTYLASSIRLKNRLNDLKLNEIQVDSFLEKMAIHCFKEGIDPKEFLFQAGRVCSIAEYLHIPIMQLPDFLEEKTKENKDSIE